MAIYFALLGVFVLYNKYSARVKPAQIKTLYQREEDESSGVDELNKQNELSESGKLNSQNELSKPSAQDELDGQNKLYEPGEQDKLDGQTSVVIADKYNHEGTPIEPGKPTGQTKMELTATPEFTENKPRRIVKIRINSGTFRIPRLKLPNIRLKKPHRQSNGYKAPIDPLRQEHKMHEAEFRRRMQQKDEDLLRELKQRREEK